jgi:hypothetical protein
LWFAISLNVITIVAVYWIPESPRYLYGINDLEKCREIFIYIAKKNGIQDYQPPLFEADYEITAERVDEISDQGRPSEQIPMIKDPDGNFDSVISKRDRDLKNTGSNAENRLTAT